MPAYKNGPIKNRILSTLTRRELRQLRPSLEQVSLREKEVLYAPGDVIKFVYFPDDAIVSLLLAVDGRGAVEVAMEGNEGAVGFAVSLGGEISRDLSVVRSPGTATRIELNALTDHATEGNFLQELLDMYVHALVTQVAQSGICNRFHSVDARLARWLLMTQDRTGSTQLKATQSSIAHTLGVRRSSVTAAAGSLSKQSIISYTRGRIEILSQRRLRDASCGCYGIMKDEYDEFLGREMRR